MSRPPAAPQTAQLSLFGEVPAAAGWPAPAKVATTAPEATFTSASTADSSAASTAPSPAVPASAPPRPLASGPQVFLHPQAQRDIRFGEHLVGYALRRARRRSIGFCIGVEGLTVSAPRWVGLAEVEAALREKAPWILRKLQEQRERGQRVAAARIDWREGTCLPFLGQTLTLVLDARATGAVLHGADDTGPGPTRLRLHLGLPQAAAPEQIRDTVQSWLQRQARRVFEERCALVAPRLGVRMKRLALSSAATRWGSASADGSIRLNWRLVHFGLPVIDYVVTHELAHLREMNHSPAFWDVVRSAMPDFETARGALRAEVLPVLD